MRGIFFRSRTENLGLLRPCESVEKWLSRPPPFPPFISIYLQQHQNDNSSLISICESDKYLSDFYLQLMSRKKASNKSNIDLVQKQAFKLFAQGRTNEQIIQECGLERESLNFVLQPRIQLVLELIEKVVTRTLSFERSTNYFMRRKQFIDDILMRRTDIISSRSFQPAEKDLVGEFLSVCLHYATYSQLDSYVYLKLELIFDKIYYSPKAPVQLKKQNTQKIDTIPKKIATPPEITAKPKQMMTKLKKNKQIPLAANPVSDGVSDSVINQKDLILKLKSKEKQIEQLKLDKQILIKRSKILQMEAQIQQMQQKKGFKSKIIPEDALIQTLITPEEEQLKAEQSAEMEDQEKIQKQQQKQYETQIQAQIQKEDDKNDEEYIADFEQSKENVPKKKTPNKRSKSAPRNTKKNKEPKPLPQNISIQQPSSDKNLAFKKLLQYEEETHASQLPKKRRQIKRKATAPSIPSQNYLEEQWLQEEERYLIEKMHTIKASAFQFLPRIIKRKFGKNERFQVRNIKLKKQMMMKVCKRKFVHEVVKRKSLSAAQQKQLYEQLMRISTQNFQFAKRFIHQYYFCDIDIVVNKALNDTLDAIRSFRKPQRIPIGTSSTINHEIPLKQAAGSIEPNLKNIAEQPIKIKGKRELIGLDLASSSDKGLRNRKAQTEKVEIKKEIKISYADDKDFYYEEESNKLDNLSKKVKQQKIVESKEINGEEKNAFGVINNIKSAFQNYIQPQEKIK